MAKWLAPARPFGLGLWHYYFISPLLRAERSGAIAGHRRWASTPYGAAVLPSASAPSVIPGTKVVP